MCVCVSCFYFVVCRAFGELLKTQQRYATIGVISFKDGVYDQIFVKLSMFEHADFSVISIPMHLLELFHQSAIFFNVLISVSGLKLNAN